MPIDIFNRIIEMHCQIHKIQVPKIVSIIGDDGGNMDAMVNWNKLEFRQRMQIVLGLTRIMSQKIKEQRGQGGKASH